MACKIRWDWVTQEGDLHEVEREVDVGSEVVKAALKVCVQLIGTCKHPGLLLRMEGCFAAAPNGVLEFSDLIVDDYVRRGCGNMDDLEGAVVVEDEVFYRADVLSQTTPIVCQLAESWNALDVIECAFDRGQQTLRGIVYIPLSTVDARVAAIQDHDTLG